MSFEQKYVDSLKDQRNSALDHAAVLAARLSVCEEEKEAMNVVVAEQEKQVFEKTQEIDALTDQLIRQTHKNADEPDIDPH